ncbi:MAG TPA: hypothetical protein VII53_08730 [Solirubrobacteraceae bacterium]
MSQIKKPTVSRFTRLALAALSLAAGVTVVALFSAAPALAASPPVWSIQSVAAPTIMQSSDTTHQAQDLVVNATGGTYTLTFEGQTTGPLFFIPGAGEVQSALDGLSTIGGAGGSVTVKRNTIFHMAGQQEGFVITFAGALRAQNVPLITTESSSLTGGTHTATVTPATNDEYDVQVENIGGSASSGMITVTDKLPPGVTTTAASLPTLTLPNGEIEPGFVCTSGAGLSEVTCKGEPVIVAAPTASYNNNNAADPGAGTVQILIPVTVSANVSGSATNTATISGGGAPASASVSASNPLNSSTPPAFGVSYFSALVSDEVGLPFTQAGGHPYAVTVNFGFNSETEQGEIGAAPGNAVAFNSVAEDDSRELAFDLPLGLVGNPLATPRCSLALVAAEGGLNKTACPRDTQVGIVYLHIALGGGPGAPGLAGPFALFNVVPEPGRPGEFAFNAIGNSLVVLYGEVVRTPLGSVVRLVVPVPRAYVNSVSTTFFGNPVGAFDHPGVGTDGRPFEDTEELPFLIDPTNCQASEAQRTLTMHVDSWYHPGAQNPDGTPNFGDSNWKEASTVLPPVEGCNLLEFNPSHFELAPSGLLEGAHQPAAGGTTQADEPSAYEGRLKIPQVETFGTLSRPELKSATVTLPAGLSVSASAANGLEGCTEAQLDPASGEPGHCPDGSKLGTVEVTTPLLEKPLKGHVYLAEPKCGGDGQPACGEAEAEEGKLFGLDMELDGEAVIKLPGDVEAGGHGAYSAAHGLAPGQLRAVFENNPQLPFGELLFKFKEGPRTSLANPQTCGTYTTTSVLEPWSAPFSANATSESPFNVDWDGKGGACPSSMPFSPGFTAGTASSAAGAYSPLSVEFSRQDREQDLSGISVHMPPGLLGNLSGIPLCGEAQAAQGACGEASQIGTTSAVVGPGEDPFAITDGRVYLTGPYKGAPFGLSIVVPANAGPFHLGNVVVRATIAVDPHTAALTVTSDALPQVVDSVPIRLRKVIVDVNRPGFMFNATNCVPQKVEATLAGIEGFMATSGSSALVSSPYNASGCAGLAFNPAFAVSTQGKTSRADGASLTVKVAYPQGSEANIKYLKVELPKQLPSRLTTLQKACTAAQFEANPAGCPAASVLGTAVAVTPVLSVPLTGPAYFVSHGGAAFPDLEVVLQGEGVKVVVDGSTFISKAGITSTTFNTVPDAPISSFQLTLPEGPDSALAANGDLCTSKLVMPTTIDAQNGKQITQQTKVAVTGCKPAIAVIHHSVKGKTATIAVSVPSAGKLVAAGKGLSQATGKAGKAGTVTVKLRLSKKEQAFLVKRHGRRLKTKITLQFTPTHGAKLKTSVTVLVR